MNWIITGANRGIGLELTRQLAARGETVIATARNVDTAQELNAAGVRVEPLDITDDASVASFVDRIAKIDIDVLINNAGQGVNSDTLGSIDMDNVRNLFEVNAIGTLRVTQALLPALRRGSRKLIANMTSKMGSIDDNGSGSAYGYRASKAALNAITKSLAIDLANEGFTCLVLHPGWVQTQMGGASAPLSTEDSAGSLLEVMNRSTPSQTGRFLNFDGAELAW
ncbi:MAG: NAD(P)-dependent dehydrogenase (short-subunit alcohol dehydrogenase family) [Planctomycetota bacterium]|jgi:NAD(P)-dependent dehydrogenase (short-subunit alcohol dehydrogenase family)